MGILCWMRDKTGRDMIRNDNIRERVGVVPMVERNYVVSLLKRMDKMDDSQVTRVVEEASKNYKNNHVVDTI